MAKSKSLGNLLEFNTLPNKILATYSQGRVLIESYANGTTRLRITENDEFEDFPNYTINQNLAIAELNILADNEQELILKVAHGSLVITKNPFQICLLNDQNQVLFEDKDQGFYFLNGGFGWCHDLQADAAFTGLGEKSGPMNKRGRAYVNWNSDAFAYHPEQDPLYASIPFYMAHHSKGSYGVYLNNTHKSWFNFGASNNRFSASGAYGGEADYWIMAGNPSEILAQYTGITGKSALPPLWSLGFQQCRYSYYPEHEVINAADEFRFRKIPCDVIYLDIHYMDAYKVFTWDKNKFPQPEEMIKNLRQKGFRLAMIFDPGVKVEENYPPYHTGLQEDLFAKYPDGSSYEGAVWPGWCHFPDFTMEKARNWWAQRIAVQARLGVSGFWNDMNEPATWGQSIPNLVEFDFENQTDTLDRANNIYGMLMARATFEGAKNGRNGERPFVLTRAGFSGIQQYAALWTGDNVANEDHMLLGVRLVQNLGLSGVSYTGFDIGGFVGECDAKLFARWMSIGAFMPLFRVHAMINSRDSEPWAYGEESEEIARNYINLRYRLLPYLYSTFQNGVDTGLPLVRSLVINHLDNPAIFAGNYQNQFYFGDSMLVCPVRSDVQFSKVLLPEGNWYYLFDDAFYAAGEHFVETPLNRLPIFVKAGGITMLQPLVQSTSEKPEGALEIHVYTGADGSFIYYEDDGLTYKHEKGEFLKRNINYNEESRTLSIGASEGKFKSIFEEVQVFIHGQNIDHKKINLEGLPFESGIIDYHFVDKVSDFDPFEKRGDEAHIKLLPYIRFKNNNEQLSISF